MGRNTSLAKCTSTGNFFCKRSNSDKESSKRENGILCEDDQVEELRRRIHSTSESSCGAESENMDEGLVERVSPNGLAWTVPVNGSSPTSPRSPSTDNFHSIGLRHLQQHEEDEYEENLEDSEDGFIDGLHPDLTPLVNLMNVSSSSPSDSELSRCGSQAGLTSESEEEISIADEERVDDLLSPVAEVSWIPQEGAGEAMVPSDVVTICEPSLNKKDSTKDIVEKEALPEVITPFSDADEVPQEWSDDGLSPTPEMHI